MADLTETSVCEKPEKEKNRKRKKTMICGVVLLIKIAMLLIHL